MRRRKIDDSAVKNRSLHRTAHHSTFEKGGNTGIAVTVVRVAKMSLEGLPIHRVIRPQESKVREEPISIVSANSKIANNN